MIKKTVSEAINKGCFVMKKT
ncbi:unnamed protein product [Acanthoscelides obtectus]|uniref:Uncharacterized protein n=1 Tax=Acanthoscelides obtectus TaxID=200917 RepID=A0A9P0JPM8_ACAOB|nr:unnamed protein product [Acanthoscelides obtectus]CAK1661080.1 hypothetical protein AOBTE_LOCUS22427 [Acanthoscelides obtectus]